jgi:hypothetical protein
MERRRPKAGRYAARRLGIDVFQGEILKTDPLRRAECTHSLPTRAPLSATERFMNNTKNATTNVNNYNV